MLTDHEQVVADLEAYVLTKNSHGQRDLLTKLAELRSKHRVQESLSAQLLRMAEPLDPEPTEADRVPVGTHGSE